jgi:hypothetical protein
VSRHLTMVDRQVPAAERSAYLTGLAARRAVATAQGQHFWVFECEGEPGRFLEFAEGPDAVRLPDLLSGPSGPMWREVAIIEDAHTPHSH